MDKTWADISKKMYKQGINTWKGAPYQENTNQNHRGTPFHIH